MFTAFEKALVCIHFLDANIEEFPFKTQPKVTVYIVPVLVSAEKRESFHVGALEPLNCFWLLLRLTATHNLIS